MKNYSQIVRHVMIGLALLCALALSGAVQSTFAQDASGAPAQPKGGRDPFVKYKPPVKTKVVKSVSIPVEPPPIQVRIENYKAQKIEAMKSQKPAPKPTTALLLSEMQVMGIFRTPRGYAAMVEATPIKLSYVIYPGEVFYDGQLVAIEENRLVFRREKRWSDGKRELAVETKPLRQTNAVTDSLAATKASGNSSSSSASSAPASNQSADQDKQ
jgi:hypothetical protein